MTYSYFELKTPKDMLDKARRECNRMNENFHVDHVFNFFVTAYHVRDYILKNCPSKQAVLEEFLKDSDLKACHDLCDKGKHLKLDSPNRVDPVVHTWQGYFGGAPFGTLPFGSVFGPRVLITDTGNIEIKSLANRILKKWEDFFAMHEI